MIIVTKENVHEQMLNYINNNDINVSNYETMTEIYLKMLQNDYCFVIDRDLLKEIMIDIAYKICPNDDFNRDLVLMTLSIMDEDESDED